jgi:hypothetical protein
MDDDLPISTTSYDGGKIGSELITSRRDGLFVCWAYAPILLLAIGPTSK